MIIITNPTATRIKASAYELDVTPDGISVIIAGESIAVLNPHTALDITEGETGFIPDEDCGDVTFNRTYAGSDKAIFEWTCKSSLWEKKTTILTCLEDRFEYSTAVCGNGTVDSVNYFLTRKDGGTKGSSYEFCEGFFPDVDLGSGNGTYPANKSFEIYPTLSVPPMFYHSYRVAGIEPCIAFGLVAEAGEHNFTNFGYHVSNGTFSFRTNQDGHVTVNGEWTTPKIVVYTAENHYDAGEKYCSLYFDSGICSRGSTAPKPRFWYGPIACGWIEQCAFGNSPEGDGSMLFSCRQMVYERMVERLWARDLHPTCLIIDDKWQDQYGTAKVSTDRWPDLRGFIDRNLENGIHTFMWYQLWNCEGLPDECCSLDEEGNSYIAGNRKVADPSHPIYKEILRENIHRIISSDEGCYNAAGLKLDFAFCQPHGRKTHTYSGKYGTELLYDYLSQIRTYAKEAKPDAVINASPCHPLFASLVDQARLHDYDGSCRNAAEVFPHRAKLWGTANPCALIDTDGGGFNTNRDMIRFMLNQPKIGIPDLYAVSDLPNFAFTEEEWEKIARAWRDYSEKADRLYK